MSRWYWGIGCDNTVEDPLIVDSADLGMDSELLQVGESCNRWSPLAWLRASKPQNDGTPDDVLQNHLGLPVYSARLRSALEREDIRGVQYLPVRVFGSEGEELKGFAIANIVERRAALNRKHSEYDVFPKDYFLHERRGHVRGLRRVVLNGEALEGCDIVRLQEFLPSIFVSARFRKVFETGNFSGYSFREVQVV